MAKPVITFRNIKAAALTYSELDTNFQNLRDATINFTDGSNTLSMDLNDIVTFDDNPQHNLKILVSEETGVISIDNDLPTYTLEPMGFENRTDSTINFNIINRVFSISPRSPITEYRVWCHGEMYSKTATETVTLPNVSDLYFIYFDSDAVLQYKTSSYDFSTDTMVALVQWNASTGDYYLLGEERHGITMDWSTHEYLNATRGMQYASGLSASNYSLVGNGSSDSHAQIDLSNGVLYQEDIKIAVTHSNTPNYENFQQDLQGPGRFPVAYHSGNTGQWRKDSATDFPVKQGTARITYNFNSAGTWTTPDASANHFVAYWLVATPNIKDGPIFSIMGQREDTNIGNAQTNNTWSSLDLTNFPGREVRPLYRLIFQTGSYGNTVNAKLVDLVDYRTVGVVGEGTAVGTSNPAFQNVVAGGLTLTADSATGTLTLVAGSGITISADSTTDTVTITNSGANLNTNTITVGNNVSGLVYLQNQPNNSGLQLTSNGGGAITFYDAGNALLQASGELTVTASNGIVLDSFTSEFDFYSASSAGAYTQGFAFNGRYLKMPTRTTTERNALTAANGMIIYNTTDNKFQGYANGTWVDLH